MGVLRRLLITVVAAFLLGQICLIASIYVTVTWAQSDETIRDYYAPNKFDVGQDIFKYATALCFGFFVYYSWICTPWYLKGMRKRLLCQNCCNVDGEEVVPQRVASPTDE